MEVDATLSSHQNSKEMESSALAVKIRVQTIISKMKIVLISKQNRHGVLHTYVLRMSAQAYAKPYWILEKIFMKTSIFKNIMHHASVLDGLVHKNFSTNRYV